MNKNVFLIYLTLGILMSPSAYGRMVEAHPNQGAQVVEKAKPAGLVDQARRWWNRTVNQATKMANDFFKSPKPEVSKVAEKKAERVEKVKELKEALPDYVQKEKGTTSRELADLESIVKATPVIVEQGKVEADPSLPKTKAGVPTASVYKEEVSKTAKGKKVVRRIHIDKIPLLRVGREPRLSRQDLSLDVKILTSEVKVAKPLKTPADLPLKEREPWLKMEVAKAESPTKLDRKKYGLGDIVSHRTVDAVDPKLELNENVFAALAVQELTPNQQKLLAAQILYDKGDKCHLAIGLLDDLRDNKFYGKQANYFLGLCAHKMGFFSESTERLLKSVRTEDPELVPEAIRVLVSDLPTEYEEEVAMTLVGLKNKSLIPKEAYDNANYIQAKGLSKKRRFKESLNFALKVTPASKHYRRAQFLAGISEYDSGQVEKAIKRLDELQPKVTETDLKSLINLTLARIYFRRGEFKKAHKQYLNVGKDSSVWVQALTEQGWAQLMIDDWAGAIGNMYSLHSPYFNAVYKPESYAVRAIGYLNICQYGDAYQTLNLMEDKYRNWKGKVTEYLKASKDPLKAYKTIRTYLSGKSQNNVDNLPYQVIREIARQRNFLNEQESINQKEDEIAQYSFIHRIIRKDQRRVVYYKKKAQERLAEYVKLLKKAKKDKSLAPRVNEWIGKSRREIALIKGFNFEMDVYKKSRSGFRRLQKRGEKRLAQEKAVLRRNAGKALVANLSGIKDELVRLLDNNELLRYEVFSGSGQNIRYQVAGGGSADANRVPANVKPQKQLNWSFSGEYWEDEIGNYRSQLKNNCPKAGTRLALPKARAAN